MPTNILRKRSDVRAPASRKAQVGERIAVLTSGRVRIRLRLAATQTADRVWQALPLHGVVETWGQCVHFETPLETGRDRTAKINGVPGEIYFWTEEDRIMVPFGPTPVSRPGECRLPRPCNVWATALDDVAGLNALQPGQKIALLPG